MNTRGVSIFPSKQRSGRPRGTAAPTVITPAVGSAPLRSWRPGGSVSASGRLGSLAATAKVTIPAASQQAAAKYQRRAWICGPADTLPSTSPAADRRAKLSLRSSEMATSQPPPAANPAMRHCRPASSVGKNQNWTLDSASVGSPSSAMR